MTHGQRYACVSCPKSKVLPEHPRSGPLSIRTGCPNCEKITRHVAEGRSYELAGASYV